MKATCLFICVILGVIHENNSPRVTRKEERNSRRRSGKIDFSQAIQKQQFGKRLTSSFSFTGYAFLVTWLTAFCMVLVHERVPDSKRYPPLPDIFLDNVPHIGWAFWACEVTGALLFAVWVCVLVFHKYRWGDSILTIPTNTRWIPTNTRWIESQLILDESTE